MTNNKWAIVARDCNGNWYEFTRILDYSKRREPLEEFKDDVRKAIDNPGGVVAVYRPRDVVFSGNFDDWKQRHDIGR